VDDPRVVDGILFLSRQQDMRNGLDIRTISIVMMVFATTTAQAVIAPVTNKPAAWRIENFPGGQVVLWYTTGAYPCPSGQLALPATATPADVNRLWSLVAYGKATGNPVFIYYESSTCQITSFGADFQ
jgi:hypothetical protein